MFTFFFVALCALLFFLAGYMTGVNNQIKHTDYLNNKYLIAVKKAQRANNKNKATAEFWYDESERYKALLEVHNQFLKKYDQ